MNKTLVIFNEKLKKSPLTKVWLTQKFVQHWSTFFPHQFSFTLISRFRKLSKR